MSGSEPRSGKRWKAWVFAGVLCGLAGGGASYWQRAGRADPAPAIKPAGTTATPKADPAVVATGTIRLRTGAEVRVGAQLSGIVTQLNVTVGSHVKQGAVVAQIESRGLDARIAQARSQIEVDRASLEKVRRDVARTRELLAAHLVARQQAEDLEADLNASEARLDKSRSDLALVESDLPYLSIRAPIAGTVSSISTQMGETVAASLNAPTFVTIIEDHALELVAMVDETDIANIRPRDPVTFTTETYPARDFHGTVERIAPKATIVSGVVNYEVGIAIRSGMQALKPDMTANVTIETQVAGVQRREHDRRHDRSPTAFEDASAR